MLLSDRVDGTVIGYLGLSCLAAGDSFAGHGLLGLRVGRQGPDNDGCGISRDNSSRVRPDTYQMKQPQLFGSRVNATSNGGLRRNSRFVLLVCLMVAAFAVGCSSQGTSSTPPTSAPDETSLEARVEPLNRLTSFWRSSRPEGLSGEIQLTEVVVPASLDEVWDTWGPTSRPAPEPPEVPAGHQVVVVWDAGSWLNLDGYRINADGSLVIVGTRELPGSKCVEPAVVGSLTWVLSVDDERVVPGMAIAEVDVREVVVEC